MKLGWLGTLLIFIVTVTYADQHSLQIDGCDSRSVSLGQAAYLLEPWDEHSKEISDQVRLATLRSADLGHQEYYLLILGKTPVFEHDPGPRQCRVITFEGSNGFARIDMSGVITKQVEHRGKQVLSFSVPVAIVQQDESEREVILLVNFDTENGNTTARFINE